MKRRDRGLTEDEVFLAMVLVLVMAVAIGAAVVEYAVTR